MFYFIGRAKRHRGLCANAAPECKAVSVALFHFYRLHAFGLHRIQHFDANLDQFREDSLHVAVAVVKNQDVRIDFFGCANYVRKPWLHGIAPEFRADHHVELRCDVVAQHENIHSRSRIVPGHANANFRQAVKQRDRDLFPANQVLHEKIHAAQIPCDLENGHFHERCTDEITFFECLRSFRRSFPAVTRQEIRPRITLDLLGGREASHWMQHFLEVCGRARGTHDAPFGIPVKRSRAWRQ